MKKILPALLLGLWFLPLPAAKLAVLADVHVSPGNPNAAALAKVIGEINQGSYDAVLVPGDLTNNGDEAEFDTVKALLDQLNVPCFAIPGNHETTWSPSAGQGWFRRWPSDRILADVGDVRLIGFATGPEMKMGDGFVRSDDLAWLKQMLAENSGKKELIVFCHYPLVPGLGNCREVSALLRPANVAAVISGHLHRSRVYDYDGVPGIVGRSLLSGTAEPAGYAEIETTPDKIIYREKIPGEKGYALVRELKRGDPAAWQAAPIPAPDAAGEALTPGGYQISLLARDPATVFTAPAVGGGALYYGTSDGKLKAIEVGSGKLRWEIQLAKPVYSNPVYVDGLVALGVVDNAIVGIAAADGKLKWRVETQSPVSGHGAARDGKCYFGDSAGYFYKINLADGKLEFRKKVASGRFQARPLIDGGRIYTGAWDRGFYALDAATGQVLWRWWPYEKTVSVLYSPGNSTPVAAGGRIYFATPDRMLNALDAATGKTVFRAKDYRYREAVGVSADGSEVYAKTMDGELISVPATSPDGKDARTVKLDLRNEHTPCPILESRGEVWCGARTGEIVAVRRGENTPFFRFPGGISAVNGFAEGPDGTLFATLIEGKIYRIERR
ncbi:MAG: PQQ-binding-like beta-propeller repeat protein [Victivallaceae bacterium]